jgi:hypothetical protein
MQNETREATLKICASCKQPFWDVLSIRCELCNEVSCDPCRRFFRLETIQIDRPLALVCSSCVIRSVEDSLVMKIAEEIREEYYKSLHFVEDNLFGCVSDNEDDSEEEDKQSLICSWLNTECPLGHDAYHKEE